jgi:hypothetical protein
VTTKRTNRAAGARLAGIFSLAGAAVFAAVLILPTIAMADPAINDPKNLFRRFPTETGVVQTATGPNCTNPDNGALGADVCTAAINPFFKETTAVDATAFGGGGQGNGQDCETCHQPQLGWSVTPEFLQDRFERTDGTAGQFRVNDTVTDPRVCGAPTASTSTADNAANVNACAASMTLAQKHQAYRLFLDLGIHRIAIKDNPALDNFTLTGTSTSVDGTESFGTLPIPAGQDSQQPCSVQAPGGVGSCVQTVSVFRRPLTTTNMFFASSILWDGRQNVCVEPTPTPGLCPSAAQPIRTPLLVAQVSGAAQTLVLSKPPTLDQEKMAAHLMTGIFTAMVQSHGAGSLTAHGATGGPEFLADLAEGAVGTQKPPCTPLVEASVANSGEGDAPPNCAAPGPGSTGPNSASPPNGRGFNLFLPFLPARLQAGANTPAGIQAIFSFCASRERSESDDEDDGGQGRIAIACGENIFNNRPINAPTVEFGFPDVILALGRDTSGQPPSGFFGSSAPPNARCTVCHAAQDVADNPLPAFVAPLTPGGGVGQDPTLFVGGDTSAKADPFCATNPADPFCTTPSFNLPAFQRRTSRLPLYTLTEKGTGATIKVTDPGLALIVHSFDQAGYQKPPVLRNLAARAPFFHNGAARDLDQLVDFYNQNFSINLSAREHNDLVAFLKAL